MKKCFGHIIAMTVSALVFLASCNNDRAELIPREDMAQIYAEMLLTDQWIVNTPNMRMIADTSLVYTDMMRLTIGNQLTGIWMNPRIWLKYWRRA